MTTADTTESKNSDVSLPAQEKSPPNKDSTDKVRISSINIVTVNCSIKFPLHKLKIIFCFHFTDDRTLYGWFSGNMFCNSRITISYIICKLRWCCDLPGGGNT